MGMYTTVLLGNAEPKDVQIKTGYDECRSYSVGDKIEFDPRAWRPGAWIDGAFMGIWGPDENGDYVEDRVVAIKDGVVVGVEVGLTCGEVIEKYDIQTTAPRELWSEDAWREQEEREARARKEWKAHLDKSGGNAALAWIRHVKSKESFLRKVLPPEAIE